MELPLFSNVLVVEIILGYKSFFQFFGFVFF